MHERLQCAVGSHGQDRPDWLCRGSGSLELAARDTSPSIKGQWKPQPCLTELVAWEERDLGKSVRRGKRYLGCCFCWPEVFGTFGQAEPA